MKAKKKSNWSVFRVVNGLIFIILALIIIIPMWKILVDSFDLKTAYGMKLWPEKFGLDGYKSVFSNPTLYRPLMISFFTTITGTILALVISTMGAYVLIQWNMPGRTFFANFLLFTMIFNGGMIPTYLVLRSLHLTNTLWVVILFPALKVYRPACSNRLLWMDVLPCRHSSELCFLCQKQLWHPSVCSMLLHTGMIIPIISCILPILNCTTSR